MKIVVLDGYTLNPGDLSWQELEAMGDLTVYDRSKQEEIIDRARDAEILFTNKTVLSGETLASLPQLRYIGVLATGVNVVDLDYTDKAGITVTNTPNYTGLSAAQMVFAMILELTHHVGHHSETVKAGKWSAGDDFCYWDYPLIELDGLTIGIVGFGSIGKAVARIAQAMGMKVLIHTRTKPDNLPEGIEHSSLEHLLAASDVVTLHCPLNPGTKGMINKQSLETMKSTAFLINISRGPLIVEEDLADILNSGRLAGAALDVLTQEPPDPDCPLFQARNCFITPHIAWATLASRKRLMSIAVNNLKAFLEGNPQHIVHSNR